MTPGIALLVIGGILLVSGWTGSNIVDTFSGKRDNNFGGDNSGNGSDGSNGPSGPSTNAGPTAPGVRAYGGIERGLTYAGPDQGVDFTGHGTVFAPADMEITRVAYHTGWSGDGNIVVGRITSGDHTGKYVYFAEDLLPKVVQGAKVKAGQVIGIATGSGHAPGIEIGFAQDAHGTAFGTTSDGKNGNPAPYGRKFLDWLTSLGNPSPHDPYSGPH